MRTLVRRGILLIYANHTLASHFQLCSMHTHFCHAYPMHLSPCANQSTYAHHSSSYTRCPHLSHCKRQVHSTLRSQHTRNSTNWAAGSSMSEELDDSINLGQGPERARTTYGFSNTTCHKI